MDVEDCDIEVCDTKDLFKKHSDNGHLLLSPTSQKAHKMINFMSILENKLKINEIRSPDKSIDKLHNSSKKLDIRKQLSTNYSKK